jgi:hypothetical protein
MPHPIRATNNECHDVLLTVRAFASSASTVPFGSGARPAVLGIRPGAFWAANHSHMFIKPGIRSEATILATASTTWGKNDENSWTPHQL